MTKEERHLIETCKLWYDDPEQYQFQMYAAIEALTCKHIWISADNEVVSGCEICTECFTIRSATDEYKPWKRFWFERCGS